MFKVKLEKKKKQEEGVRCVFGFIVERKGREGAGRDVSGRREGV